MPRFKAVVEYDGTYFLGFQRQAAAQRSVQGELESALASLSRQPVPITGAGRTDTGVHALGQVISFSIDWSHGPEILCKALNAHCPQDIAILKIEQVPDSFHPRFDACWRSYEYHIDNGRVRHALNRHRVWHVFRPLNVELMNQAASFLVGQHDFSTFGRPPQGENAVRHVRQAAWRTLNDRFVFFIQANAFLYRMVRRIVGSLKNVGEGSWSVEHFQAAFKAGQRELSGSLAPPQGLYLVSIQYESGSEITDHTVGTEL